MGSDLVMTKLLSSKLLSSLYCFYFTKFLGATGIVKPSLKIEFIGRSQNHPSKKFHFFPVKKNLVLIIWWHRNGFKGSPRDL